MSGLVLIASYPKSGNTWMRAFLASVMAGGRVPDINADMAVIPALSDRRLHDDVAGLECSDLTPAEIADLRPLVSRRIAATMPGLFKVHDSNLIPPGATQPAIPADVIDRVVHIVRDPRDVAVSAAHHFGKSIQAAVADLGDDAYALGQSCGQPNRNVEQWVSSWSAHARSWLDATDLRVHRVRYEDMAERPVESFGAVCRFLDLAATAEEIQRSVDATHFDRLAAQETASGFKERRRGSATPFFRQGRTGQWREALPADLAARIAHDHGTMMRRLGYL